MSEPLSIAPVFGVSPGTVLDGKYRIERVLGQGSMGQVVAATHLSIERMVAIKLLLPDALDRGEALARFEREVQAVSRLHSPHVAQIIDVGKMGDGTPYMVIEYLVGQDLSEWLAERGSIPHTQAVDFLIEALDALTEAHREGIVHRDVKPSNLFVADVNGIPTLKVLDFGISKVARRDTDLTNAGEPAVSLTKTHTLIGSPLYMSPEQVLAAKEVDLRSDLWSLGVVFFELLTGGHPFNGDNVGTVLAAVLSAPMPSVRALRPEVPEALEKILHRCLERDVKRRYQSGSDLARDLAPHASQRHHPTIQRILAFSPPETRASLIIVSDDRASLPGMDSPTVPAPEPSSREVRPASAPRNAWRGPLVAILVLLGIAAAIVYAKHRLGS
jgi:serine/threonine-protein kinase